MLVQRILNPPDRSFFLFGPRGVGKTTWLKETFAGQLRIDLLAWQQYGLLYNNPGLLEGIIKAHPSSEWVIIDEIQKLPVLLDEVHRLIEDCGYKFILTGSSARKLKRAGVNLLAGRAVTRQLFPFTSAEWPGDFDLDFALNWGGFPLAVTKRHPQDFFETYVNTYLRQEINEESFVRLVQPFVRFIHIAGKMNGQVLNIAQIANRAGVKRSTAESWFAILEDTMVAYRLPAWRPGFKVRESAHPKFYWVDPGLARAAAGIFSGNLDAYWLGWNLETWILHEVRAHNSYSRASCNFYYYGLPSGSEIDLVIETQAPTLRRPGKIIGCEIKLATLWRREWERPLRDLAKQKNVEVERMIGIYRGEQKMVLDGFEVWPCQEFLAALHKGEFF